MQNNKFIDKSPGLKYMLDKHNKKEMGQLKENNACAFLEARGLKCLAKNYRSPFGEIDMIMQDHDEIVFVEVRSKTDTNYGGPVETIDKNKQNKLLKSATYFLQQKNLIDQAHCRFDVIGYINQHIEWIKDAFSYE